VCLEGSAIRAAAKNLDGSWQGHPRWKVPPTRRPGSRTCLEGSRDRAFVPSRPEPRGAAKSVLQWR
jgi:hypothetical protein